MLLYSCLDLNQGSCAFILTGVEQHFTLPVVLLKLATLIMASVRMAQLNCVLMEDRYCK